jgi:hypothetical protein
MRALRLAALLAGLAGCVVADPYAVPAPQAPPPTAPAAPPLTKDQAIQAAFRIAAERRLEVDRVEHAHVDLVGRWHVDLHGPDDRAQVVLDGRDGRFLQGRFRSGDGSGAPPEASPEPPASSAAPSPPDAPAAPPPRAP